jgi:hypothetical protein
MYTSTIRRTLSSSTYELTQSGERTYLAGRARNHTARTLPDLFFSFYPRAQPIGFASRLTGKAAAHASTAGRRKRRARMNRRDVVGVRAAVIRQPPSPFTARTTRSGPCTYAADASTQRIGMGAAAAEISPLFLSVRYTPCMQAVAGVITAYVRATWDWIYACAACG